MSADIGAAAQVWAPTKSQHRHLQLKAQGSRLKRSPAQQRSPHAPKGPTRPLSLSGRPGRPGQRRIRPRLGAGASYEGQAVWQRLAQPRPRARTPAAAPRAPLPGGEVGRNARFSHCAPQSRSLGRGTLCWNCRSGTSPGVKIRAKSSASPYGEAVGPRTSQVTSTHGQHRQPASR